MSLQEKLEVAYDKYYKHKKISYEEYEMLAMTNDEVFFNYRNTEYQIIHESNSITVFYVTEYDADWKTKISERSEQYNSTVELLEQARIDSKSIREIWDEVL